MKGDRKTTNTLLMILVIPVIFYLLQVLSFIFIPLTAAMFISLLFLPFMRWLKSKKVPKNLSIFIVIVIIGIVVKITGELIQLSSREILSADNAFFERAKIRLSDLILSLEQFFGVTFIQGENVLATIITRDNISKSLVPTVGFVSKSVSMTLTMLFFVILLLADSIDFHKILNKTILRQRFASVKTFMKIEKDLIKFVEVKFLVSALTGLCVGLACWLFGVSFPIFWGLFAFIINFVQMIGSIICVIVVSAFAFVELEAASTLLFFALTLTGIQALFGGVTEPVLMGKSFSINIVTVLVMLMLWGFIWGIPGMVMSIPITVFLKIIFEQFPATQTISEFMSGKSSRSE